MAENLFRSEVSPYTVNKKTFSKCEKGESEKYDRTNFRSEEFGEAKPEKGNKNAFSE